MAVEALSYQGINRALSDYSGARACEELINLRPTTEGLVPVKDFSTKLSNVPYKRIFVHHSTKGDHLIAVVYDGAKVSVKWVDPSTPVELFSVTATGSSAGDIAAMQDRITESISFATAGNVILFSVCDKEDGKYGNYAYTFKMNSLGNLAYVETEANVPTIDFQIRDNNTATGATSNLFDTWQDITHLFKDQSSPSECSDAVRTGLNAAQEENPELCLGPIIVAIAYKTTDGNTFWTGGWRIYDPIPTIQSDSASPYVDPTIRTSSIYDAFFAKYGFGYEMSGSGNTNYIGNIHVFGTHVRLEFSQLDTTHPTYSNYWNKDTSIIQSLEVYCSKPQCYLDAGGASDGFITIPNDPPHHDEYLLVLPQTKYEDMELGNQLLYHQASITMVSLAEAAQTVKLNFGGNIQVTEETLYADAGELKRYGRLLSYNARFHYFDSVSHIDIGTPAFSWKEAGAGTANVFVRYEDDDQSELLYVGDVSGFGGSGDDFFMADIVISPSLNVKEVITYLGGTTSYVRKYRMTASSTYNYSYCIGEPYSIYSTSGTIQEYENLNTTVVGITNEEPASINVTEQYNPFVFRVEHSYLAPGNILDVKPQMAGIVDSSYGRDPLNVFTVRGVYALTQGSANVLYGAFLPICDDVISAASIPTEMGIFFLADGALWLVTGRRATLVSDALHLGPHKFIRSCPEYRKISGDETPGTSIVPQYDVSPYLSKVTFEEFVRGNAATGAKAATLSFNRFRMELFVSSRSYSYSYVLSLKYRQWYKLSRQLWQDQPGETILSTPYGLLGNISVLDTSLETDLKQRIHLQTRPFSFGYSYAHIHRSVAMVRAELPGVVDGALADSKLIVGLYGSDNLQDWKLLAYAKRNGSYTETTVGGTTTYHDVPLKFSQIRTTSSARSWRYYVICIGGDIYTDKDIDLGPVIVDFEPVIRRIG